MSIVCYNCGKKMDNLCVVKYNIDYLEQYLSEYFEKDIKTLSRRNIQNKEWVKFKSIFFNIVHLYSPLTVPELAERYRLTVLIIRSAMRAVKETDHDYIFIKKDLGGFLPEKINNQL